MDTSDLDARTRLAALEAGASVPDALGLFDELPAVTVPAILGAWQGGGLRTGHRLDGLLERYGWHGKRFGGPDEAHPLVFADERGRFSVNPAALPLPMAVRYSALLHHDVVAAVASRSLRLLRTSKPRARLRMMEYRGVLTATMTYDALPINDHFRRVDEDTLLGAMDLRGIDPPFFFVLRRETAAEAC